MSHILLLIHFQLRHASPRRRNSGHCCALGPGHFCVLGPGLETQRLVARTPSPWPSLGGRTSFGLCIARIRGLLVRDCIEPHLIGVQVLFARGRRFKRGRHHALSAVSVPALSGATRISGNRSKFEPACRLDVLAQNRSRSSSSVNQSLLTLCIQSFNSAWPIDACLTRPDNESGRLYSRKIMPLYLLPLTSILAVVRPASHR